MQSKSLSLLALALTGFVGAFNPLSISAAEPEAGFHSLFNGHDLTGWNGNPNLWTVKDGCITGTTGTQGDTKITHNTFLVYTNGDVADFELRLSYRIEKGNSGIQYRSKVVEQGKFGPIVGGYQADFEAGTTYSGILYEERMRGILAQRGQKTVIHDDNGKPKIEVTGSVGDSKVIQSKIKSEDWNDYVVIARGNHLQHFINGLQTVDVTDEQTAKAAKSGVLALQIHAGPAMVVQFKNLRIKKFSSSSAQSDLKSLQGRWTPVEFVAKGKALDADAMKDISVSIKDNTYKSEFSGTQDEGSFKLVEGTTPKAMDISSGGGQSIPAIYEVDGDTFRACYNMEGGSRPSEFKSSEDSDQIYVVYKRKSP